MKYDFDTPVDRSGTDSIKWQVAPGELPMWVADMDFHIAPAITQAIALRSQHDLYGYSVLPDEWYDAYIGWWKNRHQFTIQKDWLLFCTGVIPAVTCAVRALTSPGEKIVIQSPVYNVFFNSVNENGRRLLDSPLKYDGNAFSIDWEDLEKKLSDPLTTMMILCNPQNPAGNIWTPEELAKIGDLCARYNVIVVSDEIHCDITTPGISYTPFASVSETCLNNCVMAVTPTKAFNIAGLHTAAAVVPNEALRARMQFALHTGDVASPNAFSARSAIAAFTQGGDWLDEMRAYVAENKKLVQTYVSRNIPQIKVTPSDATYLLWLDCSALTNDSVDFAEKIRRHTGLFLSNGAMYGGIGVHFLRMNVACPRSTVEDGLARLKKAVEIISA